MICRTCREAVSAALDGEPAPATQEEVAGHLERCAACRSFVRDAEALHRRVRVSAADAVPDLTVPILLAVPPGGARRPARRAPLVRLLMVLGVVQVAVAVAAFAGAGHLGRDLAVFDLALGAGLLFAAWKPERIAGLLPLVVVLAVSDVVVAVANVVTGVASVVGELPHLLPLVAVGLLIMLAPGRGGRGTARVESR